MSVKNTVKLSKAVFQELIERGMNRPMIAKELGIKARLVNEAFDRWDLKVKRVAEVVEWDDDVAVVDSTVNLSETEQVGSVTEEAEYTEVAAYSPQEDLVEAGDNIDF